VPPDRHAHHGGAHLPGADDDLDADIERGRTVVRHRRTHPMSNHTNDAASGPLITVEKVNKHFGPHHVLKDVSTHFNAKEVTVILGASGSGKSTLLRMLNRLEKHDSGKIVVDGIEVSDNVKQLDALRAEV